MLMEGCKWTKYGHFWMCTDKYINEICITAMIMAQIPIVRSRVFTTWDPFTSIYNFIPNMDKKLHPL